MEPHKYANWGNVYDKAFRVNRMGPTHSFDSAHGPTQLKDGA